MFLNTTVTDKHFREFSAGTHRLIQQSLRQMRFRDKNTLVKFGKSAGKHPDPSLLKIDAFVEGFYGN